MTGVDQSQVWLGEIPAAREHVLIENRHQPSTVHVHTYVDSRYKLTVYRDKPYGELFDLLDDPDEFHNLWEAPEAAELKTDLLLRFLHAEMAKEPLLMPRIAVA